MPRRRILTPVEQLQPFGRSCTEGLWEAKWTYRRISANVGHNVSVVCRCFQLCLWNIPTPVDQILDSCIVQTHVEIDALCELRWLPEQHPGKRSGDILHLLCHQGTLGTVSLQQNSHHECLWPGYHFHHDTATDFRETRPYVSV